MVDNRKREVADRWMIMRDIYLMVDALMMINLVQKKISCVKCHTNEREKALMEKFDEIERLEMLQEELKRLER